MLARVWQRADTDGTGALDRDEVKEVLLQMGKREAEVDVEAAMKQMDKDSDGTWFFKQDMPAGLARSPARGHY